MKQPEPQDARGVNADVAYEKRDVNVFYIACIGVVILISAVVIHAAVWRLYKAFDSREEHRGRQPATLVNAQRQSPPEPRLQIDPASDLSQMQAAEDARLRSYGWVDRQSGVVRIPIERAMKLIAERGLPVPQKQTASATKGEGNAADGAVMNRTGTGTTKSQSQR